MFLLPLVAAWLVASNSTKSKTSVSALLVGVSIAIKWMSLPALALIAWRRRGRGLLLLVLGLLPMAIATLPFCTQAGCPVIPLSSPFVAYGRSAALIPQLVGEVWPASVRANWIFTMPLAAVMLWGGVRSLSMGKFTERYFVALMLLSPVIHAWYFTWLAPFAVASRSWGTKLVSLSAFIYFALPHGLATGSQSWMLSSIQRCGLWSPFIIGLAASARGCGMLNRSETGRT